MSSKTPRPVRTRRVIYIPGFDPVPPRKYREIYRREAAAQAVISGYGIALSPNRHPDTFGWHVSADMDGARTETDIEVLVWSDIVQDEMASSIPATYGQLIRTAWIYIASGTLFRLMRLRKGPVIAALYPVVLLLVYLALAALGGWIGHASTRAALGAWPAAPGWSLVLPWAMGGVLGGLILRWCRALDGRVFAFYLMQDYAYSAQRRGAVPQALSSRLATFADRVAKALEDPVDEVLVVGHSSGAHLAVTVLADMLRRHHRPDPGPALGFLSLGQVVPMVSFLPNAHALRADLQYLSEHPGLSWVDVTAPGDGCAFALCDPVTVSGVARPGKRGPLVISAAFSQTLSKDRWAALRWRFHRLHFQYLHAFDRPGDYDYFRITAGPRTLGDRYAARAPSRSRIDRTVSGYTSVHAV